MASAKLQLWDAFCSSHAIAERAVPLFATDEAGRAHSTPFGTDRRLILARSPEMHELLASEVERTLADSSSGAAAWEGVLYMMHWREGERIIPLYIGRAGKYGRSGGNLSANLVSIRSNAGKFARWGSNYAYHIGDLSAATCPGHSPAKITPKYRRWAERLFTATPAAKPQLRRPTYFWATAWGPESRSIWPEYGSSSLSFQEYLLIGVASDLFPQALLNDEGVNRAGPHLRPTVC